MKKLLILILFTSSITFSQDLFTNNIGEGIVNEEKTPLSDMVDGDGGSYFTIGTGYGVSYGGFGLRGQYRMGEDQKFGIHLGAGYSFDDETFLASAGFKYYAYKDFYINAQFGMTGYGTTSVYVHWNGDYYDYDYYYGVQYGPSVLLGTDMIVWGDNMQFGFNAAIGATYNINYWWEDDQIWFPVVDLGVFIRI